MANNTKHTLTVDGRQMSIREASELSGAASYFAIWKRLKAGRTDADAVFGPIIYRANAKRVLIDGKSISVAEAAKLPGAQTYGIINYRLKCGWPAHDAVFKPKAKPAERKQVVWLTEFDEIPLIPGCVNVE